VFASILDSHRQNPTADRRNPYIVLSPAALAAGAHGTGLAQEAATPRRPSLGAHAWTVPAGRIELESGAAISDLGAAVPAESGTFP
jgi:hypothetical protein